MRILFVITEDLILFYRYPGRFVASASRDFRPHNPVVVRKGVVDPDYGWKEDGWRQPGTNLAFRLTDSGADAIQSYKEPPCGDRITAWRWKSTLITIVPPGV